MRILLDTQCFLWMHLDPSRLSAKALRLIRKTENDLLLSSVSVWEIVIRHGLGKLRLPEPPDRYVPSRMAHASVQAMPIEHAHVLRVGSLPPHHRDPFDRLLVAQAQIERVAILTSDPQLEAYDVVIVRA